MDKRLTEEEAKRNRALTHLAIAFRIAGLRVEEIKVEERVTGRFAVVTFEDGRKKEADISADSICAAMYDCFQQIPELRGY